MRGCKEFYPEDNLKDAETLWHSLRIMNRRDRRLQQLEIIWKCLKTQGRTEQILQQFLTTKETEVVHEMLVVKGLLPETGDLSRLAVSLRVDAATLPDFRWASGQQARYSGLLKLNGIVLGMTATVIYTKSTKYTCPREDCEGHYGNQYVRIHVPGASEQDTVGRKFTCSVCGMGLREDKSQRSLSEKLLAEVNVMTDTKGGSKNTVAHRQQAVAVIVRADVSPPNCFFKLKLLLLISLVLTPEEPLLHVLVSGTETHLAQRLMELAVTLAPRHFTHTSLHVLGAKATTSRYPWASYFVSALSENGVQVALESRHTGSLPRVLSLPLSCHVWGLISSNPAPAAAASASTNPTSAAFSYGATGVASDLAPGLLERALSYGLCRLSLDSSVTEEHALMAVHLYEEALTARHGISALNVFSEPHLPAASAETYITTQVLAE
ncbi:hypothetical protein ACOMHN_014288 [Nucella lapillus]